MHQNKLTSWIEVTACNWKVKVTKVVSLISPMQATWPRQVHLASGKVKVTKVVSVISPLGVILLSNLLQRNFSVTMAVSLMLLPLGDIFVKQLQRKVKVKLKVVSLISHLTRHLRQACAMKRKGTLQVDVIHRALRWHFSKEDVTCRLKGEGN